MNNVRSTRALMKYALQILTTLRWLLKGELIAVKYYSQYLIKRWLLEFSVLVTSQVISGRVQTHGDFIVLPKWETRLPAL